MDSYRETILLKESSDYKLSNKPEQYRTATVLFWFILIYLLYFIGKNIISSLYGMYLLCLFFHMCALQNNHAAPE